MIATIVDAAFRQNQIRLVGYGLGETADDRVRRVGHIVQIAVDQLAVKSVPIGRGHRDVLARRLALQRPVQSLSHVGQLDRYIFADFQQMNRRQGTICLNSLEFFFIK